MTKYTFFVHSSVGLGWMDCMHHGLLGVAPLSADLGAVGCLQQLQLILIGWIAACTMDCLHQLYLYWIDCLQQRQLIWVGWIACTMVSCNMSVPMPV